MTKYKRETIIFQVGVKRLERRAAYGDNSPWIRWDALVWDAQQKAILFMFGPLCELPSTHVHAQTQHSSTLTGITMRCCNLSLSLTLAEPQATPSTLLWRKLRLANLGGTGPLINVEIKKPRQESFGASSKWLSRGHACCNKALVQIRSGISNKCEQMPPIPPSAV